jgi:hypothetical protein
MIINNHLVLMSSDMTVAVTVTEAVAEVPPSEETQKTQRCCSNCGAPIERVPENFKGKQLLCPNCLKAKKAAKDSSKAPSPAHEAPRRGTQQRRPAGGSQDRHAPRGLTLEIVELCAFRTGIAPPQVKDLLAAISAAVDAPSSDK